mmetsp:Transcript_121711/g.306209  ORF Transcript_121711/g.306209 Transcript_121711/m.306209 type:complete len:214 (+) Transcript_121711:725-1366(+)
MCSADKAREKVRTKLSRMLAREAELPTARVLAKRCRLSRRAGLQRLLSGEASSMVWWPPSSAAAIAPASARAAARAAAAPAGSNTPLVPPEASPAAAALPAALSGVVASSAEGEPSAQKVEPLSSTLLSLPPNSSMQSSSNSKMVPVRPSNFGRLCCSTSSPTSPSARATAAPSDVGSTTMSASISGMVQQRKSMAMASRGDWIGWMGCRTDT